MTADVEKVQEPEFAARDGGDSFVSHPKEVDTACLDEVTTVIQGGTSSVTAPTGSTEEHFHWAIRQSRRLELPTRQKTAFPDPTSHADVVCSRHASSLIDCGAETEAVLRHGRAMAAPRRLAYTC